MSDETQADRNSTSLLLEQTCHVCDGTGSHPDPAKAKGFTCPNCWGHKVVLTELGEQLIEFVDKYFVIHRSSFPTGRRKEETQPEDQR